MKATRPNIFTGLGSFTSLLAMVMRKCFLPTIAFLKGANKSGYLRFSAPFSTLKRAPQRPASEATYHVCKHGPIFCILYILDWL